jgi:hypothetical protein
MAWPDGEPITGENDIFRQTSPRDTVNRFPWAKLGYHRECTSTLLPKIEAAALYMKIDGRDGESDGE